MKKSRIVKFSLIALGVVLIISIHYFFNGAPKIKITQIKRIYDSNGVQLSKCTMKNNLPLKGTFVKNASRANQGTYPIDYYEHGVITKSLLFVNGTPVVGVLGKGIKQGTYKVKIQDKCKKEIDSIVHLSDETGNLISQEKITEKGLLIINNFPPGKYKTEVFKQNKKYILLKFAIDSKGSLSYIP